MKPIAAREVALSWGVLCIAVVLHASACERSSGAESVSSSSAASSSSGEGGAASAECQIDADCLVHDGGSAPKPPGKRGQCGGLACYHAQCVLDNQPMHTPCSEDGGSVCDGAGACVECVVGSECSSGICAAQKCAAASCIDTVKNGAETDVDCGGPACPKCPAGAACSADADCAGGICDPGMLTCSPSCSDGVKSPALGETDIDCGGPTCPPCSLGASCIASVDCQSATCAGGICVPPPTCGDGLKNGTETDIDCGGPTCAPCPTGDLCNVGADCQSGVCAGTCAAPTCSDGVKNGSEVDVDCGTACANPCPDGSSCTTPLDCKSQVCAGPPGAMTCAAPTCFDGQWNGDESYYDCGGSCVQKCLTGYICKINADCFSDLCDPVTKTCSPTCTDGFQNGDETDIDCGGSCPLKCALFQHCSVNSDCVNDNCQTGHCLP